MAFWNTAWQRRQKNEQIQSLAQQKNNERIQSLLAQQAKASSYTPIMASTRPTTNIMRVSIPGYPHKQFTFINEPGSMNIDIREDDPTSMSVEYLTVGDAVRIYGRGMEENIKFFMKGTLMGTGFASGGYMPGMGSMYGYPVAEDISFADGTSVVEAPVNATELSGKIELLLSSIRGLYGKN